MRAGGIDVLLDGLAAQTFRDFELVLSDCLKPRRARAVAEAAAARGIRLVHVEPAPNPFPVASFCKCANAGLRAASGEVALFMVDYSRAPAHLLEAHAAFHMSDETGRAGMMAPHRYVGLEASPTFPHYAPSDVDRYEADVHGGALDLHMFSIGRMLDTPGGGHVVDGGNVAAADADPKLRMPKGPIDPIFFHAKNESLRLEHALAGGGWDEDLDGGHCYQDSDFAERVTACCGVQWHLLPSWTHAVEIADCRKVFPLARRHRSHEDNHRIWQAKKMARYPVMKTVQYPVAGRPLEMTSTLTTFEETPVQKKLRVVMIYGQFSSAIHGPFDVANLADAALTGSESSFFNLARTLAERGHEVVVLCDLLEPVQHPSGFIALPIEGVEGVAQMEADAVIAWNEPDYLRHAPPGALRVVDQQLNDWGYCQEHPGTHADVFVFPSASSRTHHIEDEKIIQPHWRDNEKTLAKIPNGIDLDLFTGEAPARHPHRVVYCSSPDRGLHHLLSFWPEIRARVPDAELKIFYRIEPWLRMTLLHPDEVGRRARYVESALARLTPGDWGVEVVGPVSNREMARQLRQATVLVYPCDPVRYTEGFGVSVLDACAAGCQVVISDADAFPEVHGNAAHTIPGRPGNSRRVWVDKITHLLEYPDGALAVVGDGGPAHAQRHDRHKIAQHWEQLLSTARRNA